MDLFLRYLNAISVIGGCRSTVFHHCGIWVPRTDVPPENKQQKGTVREADLSLRTGEVRCSSPQPHWCLSPADPSQDSSSGSAQSPAPLTRPAEQPPRTAAEPASKGQCWERGREEQRREKRKKERGRRVEKPLMLLIIYHTHTFGNLLTALML